MGQSWLENEILRGNAFDEKSGDPMVCKTLFYYSHVFVISPNQISVPIPFTLMRRRQRE